MRDSRGCPAFQALVVLAAFGLVPAPLAAEWFIRGDTNSSGSVNVSDAVEVVRTLFAGAPAPVCPDGADANDDGKLDIADAIHLLGYLFLAKPAPVSRVRGCWYDETEDPLGCERSQACGSLGVFFVGQRSGSFSQALPRAKAEMTEIVQRLKASDQIGMAFFDAGLIRFPASGAPADVTPEMKEAALAFLNGLSRGSGTCAKPAAVAALSFAERSSTLRKQLFYFANGFNTCPGQDPAAYSNEILAEITQRNVKRLPIHAFAIGGQGQVDEAWMKRLASQNGGSFVRIIP